MPSLFDGTDKLICDALGIENRNELNHKTLRVKPLTDEKAYSLVNRLYEQMVANYPGKLARQSNKLWCCRRETEIRDDNISQETLLEKAVAMLACEDYMRGWFNQCPVATGIVDSNKDRRRAVDLVHLSHGKARLIELKWDSDTPLSALLQILKYGLAYVFARLRLREFQLKNRQLMNVKHLGLEVVGPHEFFMKQRQSNLFPVMDEAVSKFASKRTGGTFSMSLGAFSFPEEFDRIPFENGREVKKKCRNGTLSEEGAMVCNAFSGLIRTENQRITVQDRFLPGVPGNDIERILNAAPGKEIESGKFDSPESSSALAVNTFGFFLHRAVDLPLLPGCSREMWPARSLSLEATVRFPWSGGSHPVLDCLVVTQSALIGIECKRFEPFRDKSPANFRDTYWRPVWGSHMGGYESVRDLLRENGKLYSFLDAAQLVKHAFALRSEVHCRKQHDGLTPILLYVYAEPEFWPGTSRRVSDSAKQQHREEIAHFATIVECDEVSFKSCSYRSVLEIWLDEPDQSVRAHAEAVIKRFLP